jgi:hypothetical protein
MKPPEFYVGYKAEAPPGMARFLRRLVPALVVGAVALAALLAVSQKPFDPGVFEFGVVRDFTGLVLEKPAPTLLTARPLSDQDLPANLQRFLLVAPGKFGATELLAGMDDQVVELRGSLIYRGDEAMIEVVPGSIVESSDRSGAYPTTGLELGDHTLVGEIVDSKCYLGVMKPGREKTHRACAVRCLSGGIPPLLRVADDDGEPIHLLLVDEKGGALGRRILDRVAEPVAVTGTVRRITDQLVMFAPADSIRRLGQ